ncbi:MAG: phosphotransferase [bacterium]|nr:phosphotransferase [bacterium]
MVSAIMAWALLMTTSSEAEQVQALGFVLARVLGTVEALDEEPGASPAVNLAARRMRQDFEDQLVAGVRPPSIELEVHFDSEEIRLENAPAIEAAAEVLKQHFPELRFLVAGYRDAAGSVVVGWDRQTAGSRLAFGMTQESDSTDRSRGAVQSRAELDAEWQRAFEWVENALSAEIISFERQPRWRPAFFVEALRDGATLPLYLRGERGELDHGAYPFEHEAKVLQVMESEGLPVPHIYGISPDPKMIVMDKMPGRADLSTAENEQERVSALNDYMDLLADLHAIDPKRFEEIGVEKPQDAEAAGLADMHRWEKNFRAAKNRPEPLIEFVYGWLKRNVPRDRYEVSCLQVDSAQFLFDKGRVTSFLDLELACLGDPAADLAGMRGRDLAEPIGDLKPAFERYFEKTGKPIPKEVIDYHTVRFALATPTTCAPIVHAPPDSVDYVQYLGWYWVWSRSCIEVMANMAAIALPTPAIAEPTSTAFASAHDLLVDKLATLRSASDDFLRYELDTTWRNASYLRRVESMWPAMEAEETAEIDALIGRVTKPLDREAEFEAFVLEHGASKEEELLQFFQKRCLRNEALYQPVARELEGVKTQLL